MPVSTTFRRPPAAWLDALGLAALAWLAAAPQPAQAADVGVSVSISQPGVYGRIDIGRFPQPQVYVAQPVLVQPVAVAPQPVYMWVPPGHRKNWGKHCSRYGACGVPVYFVRDDWYDGHVRPRAGYRDGYRDGYRAAERQDRDDDGHGQHARGKGHDKDKGKGRD